MSDLATTASGAVPAAGAAGSGTREETGTARRRAALRFRRAGEYAWFDKGHRDAAHDLVLNLLTPPAALKIALDAEVRAAAFFEAARKQASTEPRRAGAENGRGGRRAHRLVKSAIRRTPDPVLDWNSIFG